MSSNTGELELHDVSYRFPYGRAVIEPVPDQNGTFATRLAWHRGKADLSLIETTPHRPIAEVEMGGQSFPVFLNQHSRKKRDRIILAGKRKTARSGRCTLRFIVMVEGREDKLTWRWRIGATAAAMEAAQTARASAQAAREAAGSAEAPPPDDVKLYFPFAPGRARVLTHTGAPDAIALWMHDVVVTIVVSRDAEGVEEGFSATPTLTYDNRGAQMTLEGAALGGAGVTLSWETWLSPARTEAEALSALLRHIADLRDRAQIMPEADTLEPGMLLRLGREGEQNLMAEEMIGKRGADRQIYRAAPGDATQVTGEGTDAALAASTLLGRFYLSGDDALRRRARLVSKGACDFLVADEESPHWGAIWDACTKKRYHDINGSNTLSVATTARTAKGLHLVHAHFDTEIYQRTALAATQWLLLKMDRDGYIAGERFTDEGPPVEDMSSPWTMCEALIPLVETFRANKNEVFLKAALRIVGTLKETISQAKMPFEQATTEHLAAAIEGVLLVSREYESAEMIALAKLISLGLRVRRLPDGSLAEPPGMTAISPLVETLAGARAALALARVDDSPQWPLFAMRALRAADRRVKEMDARGERVNIADRTSLCALVTGLLLVIGSRAANCAADRDLLTITRNWQTFKPDPATREFIRVYPVGPDGKPDENRPVDYLALVCPISLQVLVTVFATPDVSEVRVIKNGKTPFLKNLMTGELDLAARLEPLGDGTEANYGIFLADT
jgi:hypothetical protein